MVTQYPDTITFKSLPDSVQDSEGNWITGDPVETSGKCRAESYTSNGFITTIGGERTDFAWVVYMPSGAARIKEGTDVTVVNELGETLCNDTVKRFSRGQLNVRIWL